MKLYLKECLCAQPVMFCRFYANERDNAFGCLAAGYVMVTPDWGNTPLVVRFVITAIRGRTTEIGPQHAERFLNINWIKLLRKSPI